MPVAWAKLASPRLQLRLVSWALPPCTGPATAKQAAWGSGAAIAAAGPAKKARNIGARSGQSAEV